MSSKKQTQSNGIGLMSLLFILFLALKLLKVTDVATWSWWLITAPLWAPIVFAISVLMLIGAIAGITEVMTK